MKRNFLDNRNYRTRYGIHFTWCSFSSLSNSLEEHFYLFYFYFFKGFFWQEIVWTIITTVPVIVYS